MRQKVEISKKTKNKFIAAKRIQSVWLMRCFGFAVVCWVLCYSYACCFLFRSDWSFTLLLVVWSDSFILCCLKGNLTHSSNIKIHGHVQDISCFVYLVARDFRWCLLTQQLQTHPRITFCLFCVASWHKWPHLCKW